MFRMTIAAMLFATTATAGDYLEGYYFYVVGSIPSEIPMAQANDTTRPAFRETLAQLRSEWGEKCGVRVDIWHTNLMGNYEDTAEWTPDYWFAFIAMGETEAELHAALPESPCTTQGYVKQGNMLIPSQYYFCAQAEVDDPELFEQTCK